MEYLLSIIAISISLLAVRQSKVNTKFGVDMQARYDYLDSTHLELQKA